MTRTGEHRDVVTLINVFTVEASRQQLLVDLLTRATDESIRHLPGFVSAKIHRSVDGTRVTSCSQWRSRDDFEAMLRNPAAARHLQEAEEIASNADPHLYDAATVRAGNGEPLRVTSGAAAIGAFALGVLALGAFAIGAVAVGRLTIGALSVRRGAVSKLALANVTVGRLSVRELNIDRR